MPKTTSTVTETIQPAQVEAEAVETVEIEWRGLTFTVPADGEDWPVEVSLAFEEGKATVGVRGLVQPKQWDALMKTKPRNKDLGALFDTIAQRLGLSTAGE